MTYDPALTVAPEEMAMEAPSSTDYGGFGGNYDQELQRRINLVNGAAPIFTSSGDGIAAATQMATSPMSDEELVAAAKSQAAIAIVEGIRSSLDAEKDGAKRWAMYNGLDGVQKKMLQQGGYVPPPEMAPEEDESFLGTIKQVTGDVVGGTLSLPGIKQGMELAGKGLSQVQHVYRAHHALVEEKGWFYNPFSDENRGLGVQHFMDAWDETGSGEKTYNAKALDRVNQAIPEDDKFEFVLALAGGQDPYDYLTKDLKIDPNDPTFQDTYLKYTQYMTDKKVIDSIADLKNQKVSFGRDLAGVVGFKRGSMPFNIMSGGLDATFDIFLDPLLIGGKVAKGSRLAKHSVDTARLAEKGYLAARIDELVKIPKFEQAMTQISTRLSEGNQLLLMQEMPSMRKGINGISTYFAEKGIAQPSTDDVIGYFKSEAVKTDLIKGNFNVPHFPSTMIPMYGKGQQIRSGLALELRGKIDQFRLADYGLDSMSLKELKTVYRGIGKSAGWATVAQAQAGIGEFLNGLMTKVPAKDWMNPLADDAPQIFRSMMDYALPKNLQQSFLDDFLKARTVDARRQVYNSAVDSMWHYSGAYSTDAGKEIYRQITQVDQVYRGAGKDLLNGTAAGVLEIDHATAWAIPTFKDMLKATKDVTTVRRLLDETNDGMVGRFMNHWRPQVLLRVGFIPRAYGEELLSFVSREGIRSLGKSYAALSAMKTEDAILLKPVRWLADSMLDHIPLVGDHIAMTVDNMTTYADRYFKDFAERIAGDELMSAARMFTRYGALDSAARETGQFFGIAREDVGERIRRETLKHRKANGDIVTSNVSFGKMVSHMRGDAFYHHTVYREMRRVADSELARPIMDAMRRRILPEEGESLVGILRDQGFLPEMEPHIPMIKDIPRYQGLSEDEFLANIPKPKELTKDRLVPIENYGGVEITPHADIKVSHTGDDSVYHYIDPETGNVLGQLSVAHGAEGTQPRVTVHTAKGVDDSVEEALVETANKELMAQLHTYEGFGETRYAKKQEFKGGAQQAEYAGEPIPRTDLNYGHALLRARQMLPDAVMPKFEQMLVNEAFVSRKAVIQELVENDMPEEMAAALVDSALLMTPRQRVALFTQDGPLERMMQAKRLDPNSEFEMADIPGFTSERYYHGSMNIPESGTLKPIHYEEGNLYGPGFYLTEDPSVATEYTEKAFGATGPIQEPRQGIWQLGWQGKKAPNLADLDAIDIPPNIEALIEKHFGEEALEQYRNRVIPTVTDPAPAEYETTMGQIIERLAYKVDPVTGKSIYSGPKAEAFIKDMQKAGYDGWTHIGGMRMGSHQHKVSIIFDTSKVGVLKAPGYDKVPGFLPTVRQTLENEARKEYDEHLLSLWSEGGSTHEVGQKLARTRLSQGDMSHYGQLMRRGQEVSGDVVASRPVAGSRRVYTVLAPAEQLEVASKELKFSRLGKVFDHEEGWAPLAADSATGGVPTKVALGEHQVGMFDGTQLAGKTEITLDELRGAIAKKQEEYAAQLGRVPEALSNTQMGTIKRLESLLEQADPIVPFAEKVRASEMAWFTTDHHEAVALQQKLLRYKPDAADLKVGYTDVPEEVFRTGRASAQTGNAAGLDPLAKSTQGTQVWVPKEWRRDYQALGDDYQMLEPPVPEGHARLYKKHYDPPGSYHELNKYEDYVPNKGDINRTFLKDDSEIQYVDVPKSRVAELGDPSGRLYMLPKEEFTGQALKTDLANGVDQAAAYAEWGHSVSGKVHDVFGGQGQPWNETLADVTHKALDGKLRVDDLWDLKSTELADETIGPQILTNEKDSFLNGIYRYGFDKITQAGDAMIRSPMLLHNYAKINPSVRSLVTSQLGDPQSNQIIQMVADHLGVPTHKAVSAWYSLPEDIRLAVNPLDAAIARDPIPANLRLLQSKEDLQKLAGAAEALYVHKDYGLLEDIEEEILKGRKGIVGAFPSFSGEVKEGVSLNDLVDSYLGLPDKMRTNVMQNGLPRVFPEELMGKEMPLTADQWAGFRQAIDNNKFIEQTIHDISLTRALNDTTPWIDNHHLRSQFQEHARNFIPFWFAQEAFMTRTAALVARDPALIRKAQLGLHGLTTFGAITQNQYGEQVYNIPFTGALMKVLQAGANVFGRYSLPQIDPMTGQVKYTLPGLDTFTQVGPSFSPVASLPLQALSSLVPEMKGISDWVSGPRASTGELSLEKMMKQIVPSYAYTIYQGLFERPDADIAMLSTTIQTAQMMEAAGLGIPEAEAGSMDVPSEKMQEYLDRLQNHTRLATIVKGVVGFFSPVSPSVNPVEQLSPEFQKLLRTMPLDEALTAFMAQHPDGLPYTVLRTKVPSGAPLPSSPEVLDALEANPEFYNEKYPNAGAWFLPQSSADDSFSQDAYNQQLAMNLRTRKSVKDWYRDYYFASAAPDYFATKEGYDRRYAEAKGDPNLRQMMEAEYKGWKEQYFAQHPVFAEEIQSPEGKQRRQRILKEMRVALDDPDTPEVLHREAMSDLIATFDGVQQRLGDYSRNTRSDLQMKQAIRDEWDAWSYTFVESHPQIRAFYNRVIKPEMES